VYARKKVPSCNGVAAEEVGRGEEEGTGIGVAFLEENCVEEGSVSNGGVPYGEVGEFPDALGEIEG